MTPRLIEDLFARQVQVWDGLAAGIDSLSRATRREARIDGVRLEIRHIPHRSTSTSARVDSHSIASRPCFLCVRNRPEKQEGLEWINGWTVLCNPYPILDRHLTIVAPDHVPQAMLGTRAAFGRMLSLSADLPGYMTLYNGPRCGASAPDHLHLQACRVGGVPLFEDLPDHREGTLPAYLRTVVAIRGDDAAVLERRVTDLMELLAESSAGNGAEPMVNVLATRLPDSWTVAVFPRVGHRPAAYHDGSLLWSPGAIDMAGVLVLPRDGDMEPLKTGQIRDGFAEVSMSQEELDGILARWEER